MFEEKSMKCKAQNVKETHFCFVFWNIFLGFKNAY